MAIVKFRGEHFFLSNMYQLEHGLPTPDGPVVQTSEQLYMAARLGQWAARLIIEKAPNGKLAKRQFRALEQMGAPTQHDWDQRRAIMLDVVRLKFALNPDLAQKLVATGDEELIEGNDWGDDKWGKTPVPSPDVESRGENYLGQILMQVRSELQQPDYSVDTDELVRRIFAGTDDLRPPIPQFGPR